MSSFFQRHQTALKDVALALSIVHVCLIQSVAELLYEGGSDYYNCEPLSWPMLLALFLNMTVLSAAAWCVIRFVRGSSSRVLRLLASGGLFAALAIFLNFIRINSGLWLQTLPGLPPWTRIVLLVLGVAGCLSFPLWHRRVSRVLMVVMIAASPLAAFNLARTAYHGIRLGAASHQPPVAPLLSTTNGPAGPRVVWILFDALEQRMVFSERPADLQVPEFDRLLRESVAATNAFPPGPSTATSLPGLTTGRYVVRSRPASVNDLAITFEGASAPTSWRQSSNVFSQVRDMGRNVGVVGWFHPYSRVFGHVASRAAAFSMPSMDLTRGRGLWEAMANQIGAIGYPIYTRFVHFRRQQQALAIVRQLVADPAYGLVFWHSALPHDPGVFNRHTGKVSPLPLSSRESYLGNVVLMDQALGTLRRDMEKAGLWENAWLIISSDHTWGGSAALYNRVDHRIPFIVKAPGQNRPLTFGNEMNTVLTRDLILAIFGREVSTAADLLKWLEVHPTPPAPDYEETARLGWEDERRLQR